MPYVRDIAKMPQNIISPQALTTGQVPYLLKKEGVSDGHQSPHHTDTDTLHALCLLCSSPVSVSSPIRSFNFPNPQFLSFYTFLSGAYTF